MQKVSSWKIGDYARLSKDNVWVNGTFALDPVYVNTWGINSPFNYCLYPMCSCIRDQLYNIQGDDLLYHQGLHILMHFSLDFSHFTAFSDIHLEPQMLFLDFNSYFIPFPS